MVKHTASYGETVRELAAVYAKSPSWRRGKRGNKKAEARARIGEFMATHHKKGRTWLPEWAGRVATAPKSDAPGNGGSA